MTAQDTPNLLITPAPHLRAAEDVPAIMRAVVLALVPALLFALYRFGYVAGFVTALAVASCVATEAAIQRFRNQRITVNDWSAVVTGLLLAAVLPPNVSWYVPVAGGVVAIGVAKHCFGGLGCNIWNPALIARAFLQVAFSSQMSMSSWPWVTSPAADVAARPDMVDVCTAATPLARLADAAPHADTGIAVADGRIAVTWHEVLQAFLGNMNGSLGEVSALALLIGGLWLLRRGIIDWRVPVGFLATVALLGWALPAPLRIGGALTGYAPWFTGPGLFHVVAGGAVIGAFFMATDMVTSPMTPFGKLIFGIGCGFMTIMIRLYSSAYPEGVCYAILLMNTLVPLIDSWTKPVKFGVRRAPPSAAGPQAK